MKPTNLSVENFMGLVGRHDIPMGALGMCHIAGINKDDPGNNSNGSGKSTILEALTWCLFGEGLPRPQGNSERGVKADEVLNDRVKNQCKVVVDLEDAGTTYTVERWRKWKSDTKGKRTTGVRLWINGAEPDGGRVETLDEAETDRLICSNLGITYEIWSRGVVFGQESSFNFCDATAGQRAEILTTVRELEAIDVWLRKCRDEKGGLNTLLAEIGGKLNVLRSGHLQLVNDNPQALVDNWEASRTVELARLKEARDAAEAQGKGLKGQLDALGPAPEMPRAVEVAPPPPTPPYAPVPDLPPDVVARLSDVRAAEAGICSELAAHQGAQRQAEAQAASIQLNTSGAECPTCRQSIAPQHRDACLRDAAAGIERARQAVAALNQRHQEALKASAEAQDAHEAAKTQQRAAQEAAHAQQRQAQEAFRQVQEAQRQSQAGYALALRGYQNAMQQRATLEASLHGARVAWKTADERAVSVLAAVNPHAAAVATWQARVATSAASVSDAEAEQKSMARKVDVCLWWEKELPRFRTWLFDAIVDELASEANRWLKIMAGGVIWIDVTTQKQVGKNLRDELDVQIHRWNPDGTTTTRPYRVWSGGEKRRVALAVDLGLSRLMARRAAKAYSFLAMDEVDRHLDAQGREGLRAVLGELRQEKETTLIITHDPEFRASFDAELTVQKSNGLTTIEVGK